ncbi:hypothetical protein [Planctomycetes bacterium Poly30]
MTVQPRGKELAASQRSPSAGPAAAPAAGGPAAGSHAGSGATREQPASSDPAYHWSSADTEHLLENFGEKDHRVLAREIGCTPEQLHAEARRIYGARQTELRSGPWSPDELNALKRYLGAVETDLIARMIGRSVESIDAKLVELAANLKDEELETRAHVDFKRLYGTRADEDLALIFDRQVGIVRALAAELCLSKDKGFMRRKAGKGNRTKMPRWSAEELDQLREIYPKLSNLDIAKELGRSVKSIVSKAHSLRLKKDKARLRKMGQENVQLRHDR